jgi:aminoglycoside phosphotransferase (APT) family kinase protein
VIDVGARTADDTQWTADVDLVEELIRGAGLRGRWTHRLLAGVGELNRHYLVEIGETSSLIARLYGWPFDVDEPFDRMAKEAWVLNALDGTSAVVPRVLSTAVVGSLRGLLMNCLPGEVFGDVVGRIPASSAAGAWASVVGALREVHEARVPGVDRAGTITGAGVEPHAGGWGRFQGEQFGVQARRLAEWRSDLAVGIERGIGLVEAVEPLLSARPVSLIHADAHPWNVLAAPDRPGGSAWRCSGLLDWEFACAGDGLYDIVRLEIGRGRPLGPPPGDLFADYRDHSGVVAAQVYRLAYHVWMANDSRHFAHRPAFDHAEVYLRDLAGHLDRLERAIG